LAKIAVELRRAVNERRERGVRAAIHARPLARGDGWTVEDVICTSGPHDRPFEEQHASVSIALVLGGTFQYRSTGGLAVMTPGSVMLGNPGQGFECGHEHAHGDRCVSVRYSPGYFEQIVADAVPHRAATPLPSLRLPPHPALSPLFAQCCAGVAESVDVDWEAMAVRLAACAAAMARDAWIDVTPQPSAVARVTRVVRTIEERSSDPLTLRELADEARLSPWHFLRTFEEVAGVTPHQFLMRARLRDAARRLLEDAVPVLDVALDCGFGDVSNFNRAFRADFGLSPREFRNATRSGRPGSTAMKGLRGGRLGTLTRQR
jgi:AraC family transcriptional regulator